MEAANIFWTRRSRFPNYFGEISLWTGLAIECLGVILRGTVLLQAGLPDGVKGKLIALALTTISPLFAAFLLLQVSGVPLSEKKYNQKYGHRQDYQKWMRETPKIIPRFW